MLFLGNSYTFQNQLDVVVAAVFAAAGQDVDTTRLAQPGWRFVDHVAAVESAGTAHATAFSETHDWVILQEQSQIPGFPDGQADVEASRDAAVTLDGLAAGTGARTMFLMTWGRRAGDDTNPGLYPDYPTMQDRLAEGYTAYVDLASADGTPAWIAPAGLAWERVYDDVVAAGADPLAPGSAFASLYVDDGSHPSPRGTYLTACVVYASITGDSPVGLDAPDGIADAAYLQGVAASVVFEGEGIVYPWMGGDDTGGDDTGPGDTGPGDTGPDGDTAIDIAADADDEPVKAGCGCRATAPTGWLGALLASGVALVRSRVRS